MSSEVLLFYFRFNISAHYSLNKHKQQEHARAHTHTYAHIHTYTHTDTHTGLSSCRTFNTATFTEAGSIVGQGSKAICIAGPGECVRCLRACVRARVWPTGLFPCAGLVR